MSHSCRPAALCAALLSIASVLCPASFAQSQSFTVEGQKGAGKGRHVVLVSGDEEYRSEEALPQLARILAGRHGFTCTVLFAIDPASGTINPAIRDNIPGLEALNGADLLILMTRWRDLPDDQMKQFATYIESGKPVIGLRTATHAFDLKAHATYQRYTWNNKEWPGGFGRQVLGETWVAHHGQHGKQSTRGILVKGQENHPILRGIREGAIWGPSDVYKINMPLEGDSQPLVLGQVLAGMQPGDPPVEGPQNNPMMPVAWTKTYTGAQGRQARVFTTTMGASQDFLSEGFRRLVVNAVYWSLGMESRISPAANVAFVGDYQPLPFKFGGHRPGVKPADLQAVSSSTGSSR